MSRPARLLPILVLLATAAPRGLCAQGSASVQQLAELLQAEDARAWNPALFERGVGSADTLVRSRAARAIGRLGNPDGLPLLERLLDDADPGVRTDAAFAIGLVRDTAGLDPLIRRLTSAPAFDGATALEAATAIARIGGPRAGEWVGGVLDGRVTLAVDEPAPIVARLLLEAWRLGRDAPVPALVAFLADTSADRRWRAVYSAGRLRAAARLAGDRMVTALGDKLPFVRALAARALARPWVEAAGLPPTTVADLLARATGDLEPPVRIQALRSLGTYARPDLAGQVVGLLDDAQAGVQVEAAATLGGLGGAEAVARLEAVAGSRRPFALRRQALLGLARADTAALRRALASWQGSADWRERAVAGEAAAALGAAALRPFLDDADGRIVAAALAAWAAAVEGADSALVAAARARLGHADAMVRATAAQVVGRAARPGDVPALAAAFMRAGTDSYPDGALEALGALAAIEKAGADGKAAVAQEFLLRTARPANYVLRRWAEDNWPAAAERWGPAFPIATGWSLADYRDVVRRFMLPDSPDRAVHVFLDTDQRGVVEVELAGADAPLTVANFLRLLDRRFFDGHRWHRVVPNFVVQDGDPRGDGNGGPGWAIRDEINRLRYDGPVLGMALSGPDTGASQWFINLSPQPHLDGTYTVFGRVVNGQGILSRILQGDLIRSIHR